MDGAREPAAHVDVAPRHADGQVDVHERDDGAEDRIGTPAPFDLRVDHESDRGESCLQWAELERGVRRAARAYRHDRIARRGHPARERVLGQRTQLETQVVEACTWRKDQLPFQQASGGN